MHSTTEREAMLRTLIRKEPIFPSSRLPLIPELYSSTAKEPSVDSVAAINENSEGNSNECQICKTFV